MPTNTIRPDTWLAIAGLQERLKAAPKITMREYMRGHYYEIEGRPNPDHKKGWWPSVTTVLAQSIPKPALVPWARNAALEDVRSSLMDYAAKGITGQSYEAWVDGVIAAAKDRPDKIKDQAADYGSAAHALISQWITTGTCGAVSGSGDSPSPTLGAPSLSAFLRWESQDGIRVLLSEFSVFADTSDGMICGTVDWLGQYPDGRYILGDIKSGNGVYGEYAYQVGAYAQAAERILGIEIAEALILHVPKTPKEGEPPFRVHRVTDLSAALEGYLRAAAMARTLKINLLEEVK